MKRHELIGWILFTASACFFLASGIRSGDIPSLIGSALFLIACFFFMVPTRANPVEKQAESGPQNDAVAALTPSLRPAVRRLWR